MSLSLNFEVWSAVSAGGYVKEVKYVCGTKNDFAVNIGCSSENKGLKWEGMVRNVFIKTGILDDQLWFNGPLIYFYFFEKVHHWTYIGFKVIRKVLG